MYERPCFNAIRLAILLLAALLAGGAASPRQAKAGAGAPASESTPYQKGLEYKLLQEGDKARSAFQAAIAAQPEFVPAHREYIMNIRPSKARPEYEKKLQEHPEQAALHLVMAEIQYLVTRKADLAENEIRKAEELDPNSPWVHFYRGMLAREQGAGEQALAEYQKASQTGQDVAALHAALAGVYARMKHFDEALQESEQTIRLDPQYFPIYPTKWKAQMILGQASEATRRAIRNEIEGLIKAQPKRGAALVVAKQGYDMLNDQDRSKKMAAAIRKVNPNWDKENALLKRVMDGRAMIDKDPARAIKVLQKAAGEASDENLKKTLIYPALIRAHIGAGNPTQAEKLLPHVEAKERERLEGELVIGYADRRQRLDHALAMAKAAVESSQEFKLKPKPEGVADDMWQRFNSEEKQREQHKEAQARAYDLLGWVQRQMGSLADAEDNLLMSLELARKEGNVLHMAMLRKEQGQAQEALDLFVEAYGFDGKKKDEAKKQAQDLYAERTGPKEPLEAQLERALEKQKAEALKARLEESKNDELKKPASEFALTDLHGAKVKLSDLRGKVVFLNFWATW